MRKQNPYKWLGVPENASFDEIQAVKHCLNQRYYDDSQLLETIEAVYDAIIMERLRRRKKEKIEVIEQIRFPKKSKALPPLFPLSVNHSATLSQKSISRFLQEDIFLFAIILLISSSIVIFTIFFLTNAHQF